MKNLFKAFYSVVKPFGDVAGGPPFNTIDHP